MYENLRGRVSRIVGAGVSSLIGALEGLSPEGVMEEAIREVDEAAREVRDELDRVLASKHVTNKRLVEKNASLRDLDEQIGIAVGEDRDDLAEAGIARQLDIEAQIPVLTGALSELGAKEAELHSFIAALDAKKREMAAELADLRQAKAASGRSRTGGADEPGGVLPGDVGKAARKADVAASAFDRVMARETGLPKTESGGAQQEAKLAELNKLSRDNRIKERLAAVKAARK